MTERNGFSSFGFFGLTGQGHLIYPVRRFGPGILGDQAAVLDSMPARCARHSDIRFLRPYDGVKGLQLKQVD